MDLYQVCSYDIPGVKTGPAPGGHNFEHRDKESNLQNSSSLKLEGVELSYLVLSIFLWTSIKMVHIMPLGSKLVLPGGHKLEHRNKEGKLQISSSLKLEGVSFDIWY